MRKIKDGIIKENPLVVLMLGLCSTMAISTTFEKAMLLGIAVLLVVTLSNVIVSILKRWIGKSVVTPSLILIIGTLVTILELLLSTFLKPLYDAFGIYLSLIVVNCIILGRALQVAMKENVKESFIDGVGIGLGYLFSISLFGLVREILGSGTITLIDATQNLFGREIILHLFKGNYFPTAFFVSPAGAFLVAGVLLGIIGTWRGRKHETH